MSVEPDELEAFLRENVVIHNHIPDGSNSRERIELDSRYLALKHADELVKYAEDNRDMPALDKADLVVKVAEKFMAFIEERTKDA